MVAQSTAGVVDKCNWLMANGAISIADAKHHLALFSIGYEMTLCKPPQKSIDFSLYNTILKPFLLGVALRIARLDRKRIATTAKSRCINSAISACSFALGFAHDGSSQQAHTVADQSARALSSA
eukprot:TRINITY_DN6788_c0_g2_i3.p3 TRINITY_DN6788_c0_g2~~TRINITY_DN6788_c0_g2_i3.p3  ORF type:complete len:124 (-),score=19.85 TRINITY_DN6788_c0_g2_i3:48-419(-)